MKSAPHPLFLKQLLFLQLPLSVSQEAALNRLSYLVALGKG